MEDEKVKKKLEKIPDVDKNGDPIYKIDAPERIAGQNRKERDNEKTEDALSDQKSTTPI
ncbi:MAG: hypothetical protein JWN60_2556 [Acidobacteria bacterium]|jgi:hypothetical protein|nr:hypothetical protein [Acidobacteriota bacterium]